jgi:hypothetical protein
MPPTVRTQGRSEAKSTSHYTNNREAESWNGGRIQEKQCETDLWQKAGVDMRFSPFLQANSSARDLALVAEACS